MIEGKIRKVSDTEIEGYMHQILLPTYRVLTIINCFLYVNSANLLSRWMAGRNQAIGKSGPRRMNGPETGSEKISTAFRAATGWAVC
ncbi:MAG: hypothetical protein IPF54_20360 [Draconibacterium sp.]|nr:hypothetical protein [Draconibacterium sp.]